jgi:DNA-3-methyladenine glycosylase I
MVAYHDEEWGAPVHDDRVLFEFLTLEGAQAGLSWMTILRKRGGYRRAFAGFDAKKVARFDGRKRDALMLDPAIVRNRLKIESTVANAAAVLAAQREHGSFDDYLWSLIPEGRPVVAERRTLADVPAETPLSRSVSRDLKRHGFRFVGPKVVYSLMQAVGMVNDHAVGCFRFADLRDAR